jgi:putative phosphoribosyl transferase
MRAPQSQSFAPGTTPDEALPFRDRIDAGRRLAGTLTRFKGEHPLVLGIPRGGVPVAAEVARSLEAELDVIVARKLGAPMQPELAIGAVTANGGSYVDDRLVRDIGVTRDYLERVRTQEIAEAQRREMRFRGGHPALEVAGRTVILVDDGLATGATMRAAARAVKAARPAKLVIAVPVGAAETCAALEREADEVICLTQPWPFHAVGLHYENFGQTTDEEVERLLRPVAIPTLGAS